MMFKKMRKRILTVTVCAALVLQSPVFMNPAYAEPADQETEVSVSENEYGSETGEAASENGAGYENEDTLSVNDAVSKAEKAASENSSGTGTEGPVSGNEAVPENEEGEEVTGGYIEMPWDNDTPIVSRMLEYDDALEMIVEENEADEDIIQEYIPSLDRYVETQNGDPKFPTGTDEEILAYLKEKYPATRSQSPYGTCWAHSSVALAEFYLIGHGLKDGNGTVDRDVNYSELALAYFCYNQAPDPVNGNTGDTVVFDSTSGKQNNFLDFGGNLSFSSQSLMRYNGVTNDEGDAAYSNAGTVLSSGLDASYASSRDTAHLKNVYHLNIRENPKLVKQAIKENGIAGVSIYADSRYMNTEHKSYYNNVNDSTNHAVAIVGWDDNFPKEYFNTEPLGNGAWLVRNSWTVNTAFSYYSYFWLSYEDTSLADTAYIFEMADPDSGEYYDNNYNYDSQLHNVATAGSTTAANIFEAAKNAETLKAVQIDSTINIAGSYNIKVYKNLSDSSDPESGTLCASAEGTIPFAGKYTIPLSGAVELTEGESFSIVVTTEKKIDQEMDFNWLEQVVMDTVVNRGESFIKSNDVWKDLADNSLSNKYGNLCIRALTDTKGEASLPDRITSLSVKGRTDQSISLAWSAARDASGYEVWYSDSENGTYSKAGETSASEKKYRHTGLSAGTTYYYRVYPVRNGSRYEEGASPVISASTIAGTPQVEVSNIGSYTAMASWPALDSCDGYEYEVWKGNSYFSPVSISENRIRLKQLDPGTEHTLKVRSYKENAGGTKSYSEYCIVTFTTLNGSGHTVTNLKAEPYNTTLVKLTWDDQEEASSYKIERSTDGVNFTQVDAYYIGSVEPRTVRYAPVSDTNTKYYFRIRAVFWKFTGTDEYVSDAVTSYAKLPGSNITDIKAENESIRITWSEVTGANYYSVYRKEKSASEYIPLDLVPASGSLEYTDTTVLPGRMYYYRVYGCRTEVLTDSQGAGGNYWGVTIPLGKVSDLAVNDIGATSAALSWGAIRGAQGYSVREYDSENKIFVEKTRVDADVLSYKITGLEPDNYYYYKVMAFTDEIMGSGDYKGFRTAAGDPAKEVFFTVTSSECTYDGTEHGAEISCSVGEISDAGYTVYYGKVTDGAVSSYSTALPVNTGTYRIKIKTKKTKYYLSTELSDPSWSLTVSPKPVNPQVTLSPSEFTYTGSGCTPAVTVKDGAVLLTEGTDYDVTYSNNIHGGTAAVTVTAAEGGNYTFSPVTKHFEIKKAHTDITIQGGNRTVTYGDAPFTCTAIVDAPGNGSVSGLWRSTDPSVAAVNESTGQVTIIGQGTARIIYEHESDDTTGQAYINLTVNKAVLTVTAADNTITYGDEPAGNGVSYSGFVNEDTEAVLTGEVSYSYSYTRYAHAGESYSITPAGLAADNYRIVYVPGTLRVLPKEVGLEWSKTALTYNGEAQGPSAAATGLVNGDSCNVSVTGQMTDAGTYTASASGLSNPDYVLPSVKTVSFTIAKASYGDKNTSGSARYGNTGRVDLSAFIVSGGGLKSTQVTVSDSHNILNGTPSTGDSYLDFSFVNDGSKAGSTATVTVGVNGGVNYQDYFVTVTLTMLDKEAQIVSFSGITGCSVTKTYGAEDFIKTASSDGGGAISYYSSDTDVASVAQDGTVSILGVGQTTITAEAAPTDSHAGGTAFYTLTVERKEIGIRWSGTTFTYDGSGHVPDAEATGLKGGDVCTLTVAGEQINTGTYSALVSSLDNNNYRLPSDITVSFSIKPKTVVVSGITAEDKVYDGTDEAQLGYENAAFEGKLDGDVLSVTAQGVFSDTAAGTAKRVNISGITLGGPDSANYTLASGGQQTEAAADITKRPVTVRAKDQSVTLNGTVQSGTLYAELTGAVEGHTLFSVLITGGSTENVTASGSVTPSLAVIKNGNADVTGNYQITYESGVMTVEKGTPDVTPPVAADLIYNTQGQELIIAGSSPSGTVMKYSLTKNGEYAASIPEGTESGTYTVWYMVEGGNNYYDTEPASVRAQIRKASLSDATVILGNTLSYSGSTQTQTVSSVSVAGHSLDSGEYIVTGNTGVNAGSYTLTVTAADNKNCLGRIQKTFAIMKKEADPAVNITGSYVYTGDPVKPEFTVTDGLQELSASDYSALLKNNINAGQARLIITEKTGGNYSFDEKEEFFTILKAHHEDVTLSSNTMYGSRGIVDLKGTREDGASFGQPVITDDTWQLLDGTPELNEERLNYGFGGSAGDMGKSVTVMIPVTGAENYEDYSIMITLTVTNCDHSKWEIINEKTATCTEKGYTGDKVCVMCRAVLERGYETDIDPDNHSFDDGIVTQPATLYSEGVRTYTCLRCGRKKYESIPKIEGSGDIEDIMKDTEGLGENEALSYSRTEDEGGNETEILKIGGQEVSKTVTEKETGRQTVETKVWIGGLKNSYCYTGSAVKPDFHVYDGTIMLKENTDYSVTFRKNKNAGEAEIWVKFKGSYKDKKTEKVNFTIEPAALGVDILPCDIGLFVKKGLQKVVPVLTDVHTGKTVKAGAFICEPGTVGGPGEYDVTVKAQNPNFTGETTIKVRVTGDKNLLLSNTKVTFNPASYSYTGEEIIPEPGSYTLKAGSSDLVEGRDYRVSGIFNNTDPGKATMVFEAISGNSAGYVGSRTAVFKIAGKKELKKDGDYSFSYPSKVPYAKGGAKPEVTVKDGGITLKKGRDYILSYENNSMVTGSSKASVIVTGKGRYKGSVELDFDIVAQTMDSISGNILVSDQFKVRSKLSAPAVTIKDLDGKALKVKKDFTIGNINYDLPGNTETEGVVLVTLNGKGCYEGSVEAGFRYMHSSDNIKKAKLSGLIADQMYTGREILLSKGQLYGILYMNMNGTRKNLVPGEDFEVSCYRNNIKTGKAKVVIRGIGSFGGTKELTFKIVKKNVDYKGAVVGGVWK